MKSALINTKVSVNKHKRIQSPVGELTIVAGERGIKAVLWENEKPDRVRIDIGEESNNDKVLAEAEKQLNEYFHGRRKKFDLALEFVGTEFQKSVWNALLTIPYGETRSYGDIARQIGNPRSVRAVGAANGKNPISIIAPCHRVIGASGELTGFAGGLENKKILLELEGR